MKEFLIGLLELIGAVLITPPILIIGFAYSFVYSFWLTISMKKWYAFFGFWWSIIDGTLAAVGHILHGLAYGIDLLWNVIGGEMIEDYVAYNKEDTEFRKKNVTVSASIGKLIIDKSIKDRGVKVSTMLNKVFRQKKHAVDAWNYLDALRKLKKGYFN